MYWLVASLFLIVILEVTDCYLPGGSYRKIVTYISVAFITIDSLLVFYLRPSVWALLLMYFSVFRVFNLFKLIDGRKQLDYLRHSFLRSSISLPSYQALVLAATFLINKFDISYRDKWALVISIELIALIIVAMSLRRGLVKTRPKLKEGFVEDKKLPAVTVAIPARNETVDLEECLVSLVASDYPKLEILVLDDCSQLKRTPEIIRQFAHDGVRFLEGTPPSGSWTAKNFAYEQLADEANGEVILFCGVDVRFDKQTLRKMVELKLVKHKTMMSFMPINTEPERRFLGLFIQPLRYLWELGLPRKTFNRPPVLSTGWLIDRKVLKDNGSFKAVMRDITPERYFARQTAQKHDGYSFICLGREFGFSSTKTYSAQFETAVRTRYPLLKQRLENVSILNIAELVVFIAPIGLFLYELITMEWLLMAVSLVNILIASYVFYKITKLTYGHSVWLSLFIYPLIFACDVWLLRYSMWKYEFSEVIWKGRNVCIPVMGVVAPSRQNNSL